MYMYGGDERPNECEIKRRLTNADLAFFIIVPCPVYMVHAAAGFIYILYNNIPIAPIRITFASLMQATTSSLVSPS